MSLKSKIVIAALLLILVAGYFAVNFGSDVDGQLQAQVQGKPIVEVRVPELTSAAVVGKNLFEENCLACHGAYAAGQEGVAPPLIHKIYEPGHHGDISFTMAAQQGARAHHWPFGDMPPVKGITRDDVGKIIVYVRELQRANGIF